MGIVYKIVDKTTNEIIYIGVTRQMFCKRKSQHFTPTPVKTKVSSYMQSFENWQERFEMVRIKECYKDFDRYGLEKSLIKYYKPICNVHYNK